MRSLDPYLDATSVEEVWTHHTKVMAEYGFDRLIYANSYFRTPGTIGDAEDALVLSNHCPDYIEQYVHGGLFRDAPLMNWAASNIGATSWRKVLEQWTETPLSEGQRRVAELNRRHGLRAGYTISFRMHVQHSSAAIGLCARAGLNMDAVDAIWARDGAEIHTINKIAHMCIMQLPAQGQARMLTPRQTQVLELVADGKTSQDIALLIGRSLTTVDKHLRLAREALGVETTAQAVRKASMLNQIFRVDSNAKPSLDLPGPPEKPSSLAGKPPKGKETLTTETRRDGTS